MSIPRAVPLIAVVVVSGAIAFLVLGNPWQTPQQFHSRFQGTDSFLVTTLLMQISNTVAANPLGYYDLPILHPDPVPLRGTEPFVSYMPLFTVLRFLCGGDAALAYAVQAFLTVILLAVFTFAALRVLGVRPFVAAMTGIVTIALQWWHLFSDRLQILTLYWFPLVLLCLVLWFRKRHIVWLAAFIIALTCLILTSLYFTLTLSFVAIVLSPVLMAQLWRERKNRAVLFGVVACGLAAMLAFVLLLPWLSYRWDAGTYKIPDYLARKEWKPWEFSLITQRQLEMKNAVFSLPTAVAGYGSFPGFAFLLFCSAFLWAAFRLTGKEVGESGTISWIRRVRSISGWGWCVWALAGSFVLPKEPTPLLLVGDLLIWCWLGTWLLMLATSRVDWARAEERNPWLSQLAAIAGVLFMSLSLGTPMHLIAGLAPVSNGVYAVAATILPPFDLTRDLVRFILPAGWFFVLAKSRQPLSGCG